MKTNCGIAEPNGDRKVLLVLKHLPRASMPGKYLDTMPIFRRRKDGNFGAVVDPRFKYRLAFSAFYMPLIRAFLTLAITGLVEYGISTQLNANLSGNIQQKSKNTTSNSVAYKCTDLLDCGIVALLTQLFIVLPLSLLDLSSGCRVLSSTPIRVKSFLRHKDHLFMWSFVGLFAISISCFFSRHDSLVLLSMAPLVMINIAEMWIVLRLVLSIVGNKAEVTWDARAGNDLIATNEQWRSLIQHFGSDVDTDMEIEIPHNVEDELE